jgi:hypothetical protein
MQELDMQGGAIKISLKFKVNNKNIRDKTFWILKLKHGKF